MVTARLRLGQLLVDARLLTQDDLGEVLALQKADGRRLGTLLVERGLINETQLTQILSHQLSVPWVSLLHIEFSRQLLNLVPHEVADFYCLVPIYVRHVRGQGETLYVAMDDPTNEDGLAACGRYSGLPVRAMIAPPSDIRSAIRVYYGGAQRTANRATPMPADPLAGLSTSDEEDGTPSAAPDELESTWAPRHDRAPRSRRPPPPEAAADPRVDAPDAPVSAEAISSSEISVELVASSEIPVVEDVVAAPFATPLRAIAAIDAAPVIDAPVIDAPVIDAPVIDAPVIDAPAVVAISPSRPPRSTASDRLQGLLSAIHDAPAPPSEPRIVPPVAPATTGRRMPRMVALTLLDGTTLSLPARRKKDGAPETPAVAQPAAVAPPDDARAARSTDPPTSEDEDALTARDLIAALRAVAHGADASEILGTNTRWEPMFAALLSLLLKKHLIADWEFVEEVKKI